MKRLLVCVLFCLFMLHAAQARANLVSGGVATGAITAGGTSTQYFSGSINQGIWLTTNSVYQAVISVYLPSGSLWTSSTNRFAGSLPATGTYTVVISGHLPTDSGGYSLYFNIGGGSVSSGVLTAGSTVVASLPAGGQLSYQFTGSTNQGSFIWVKPSFASTLALICIYNPDGTEAQCATNRSLFNMSQTGTYTVVIVGDTYTDSGSYNLYYAQGAASVSGGVIAGGSTTTATLPLNGLASYQFTATTGQGAVVTVDSSAFGSASALICVYNPDGTQSSAGAACFSNRYGPFNVTQTGTYTVVIYGYSQNDTGTYHLYYAKGAGTVSGGVVASGSTTAATQPLNGLTSYQFTGSTNQFAMINVNPSGLASGSALICIYNPDGTQVATGAACSGNRFDFVLAQTGTYTIIIEGSAASDSGAYNLYYTRGAGTVSGGLVASGASASGTLPRNGLVSYQFTGTTHQGAMINVSSSFASGSALICIFNPDGSNAAAGSACVSNRYFLTMAQTGTYTVIIEGYAPADTGSYTMYYVNGGGPTSGGTVISGSTTSPTLPVNGLISYQFYGTTGQYAMLNVGSSFGSGSNLICVFNPDGTQVAAGSACVSNRYDFSMAQTGNYTVVVEGDAYADNGPFNLYYVRGGTGTGFGVSNGTLLSSQTNNATMPKNGLISYQFNATAGQSVQINADPSSFASNNAYIIVWNPDGTVLTFGGDRVTPYYTTLPQNGTYVVAIQAYAVADTGSPKTYLAGGTQNASEGTLETVRTGTLPVNGLRSYHLAGLNGSALTVTTTGAFTPIMYLYNPSGVYVGYFASPLHYTMLATGTYTVSVEGQNTSDTGAYTSALTVSPAPPPPPPSTPSEVATNQTCLDGCSAPTESLQPEVKPEEPITPPSPDSGHQNIAANTQSGNSVGAPINFDVGYQQQPEVDYSAGGLIFTRFYRSDSTWTNNTIGTLWRHNFARNFSVSGSAASITDGTGTTTQFTLSGSTWVPNNPATTSSLVPITGGYAYTLGDGTIEYYNSSSQLYRITYLGGGALNLSYNGSGQLTTVANENSRQLSFTYDTSGRVKTLVTPDGTFTYGYDTHSNLQTVTRPDTKVRTYLYANATYVNALTGITDEDGNSYATFGYNASGQGNLTELAGGANEYQATYNANGTSTTTNPLGKTFTNYFSNIQGVRQVVETDGAASTNTPASSMYYNYDSLGRVVGTTDWLGNVTRHQYDSRGNVTQIVQAADTTAQRVTTITPDAAFNLPDLVTEPGRTTAYAYDTYGRMTTKTVTDTATAATRIWTYAYYSNSTDGSGNTILGRLKTVTGPRTDVTEVTTYAYDANFNLNKITNALSQAINITAIDASGRPTKIVDPNSVETDLTYDSNGRLQTAVGAVGTALAGTTTFGYDAVGNLTKVTLPNSVYVSYSYDNAHRLTGVTDVLGNTITYTLNAAGNVTQKVIKNTTPATVYTHTGTFDELARLLTSVGAASQTAHYAYDVDSNLTNYTDPDTNPTAYAFDALNRLSKRTDALSGVTTPGYDAFGNLNAMKDQRSNSTTYTYNGFGDVTGETSPDRGTLAYVVDKEGNVTQRTDARSVVTNYTYDALNRLATVAYPSDSTENATLTYDLTTGCGTAGIGRLCTVVDAAGTTAYQYDVLGRVTQEKDTRGTNNFTTAYSYDLAGTLTGITLPSGRTVTYTLDTDGRVNKVAAIVAGSSVNLASSITYLPFGPITGLSYGNSLTFSGTFDQDYNPTNRTVSGSIFNWTYVTDANSNVKQAGATTYGFDALNRVNAENPGAAASYTYDATSNRLTKVQGGTTTTTVPATSNKISAVGSNSYTYDAAGDITGDGVNTYTWNAAGLLGVVKVGGTTVGTYTYDMYNQRAEKVATSTSYYVYGPGGLLYGEYTSAGALVREYVYLNGEPLAQVTAGSPEVLTYLHTDHLGTPRFATNSSGVQVWAWANDAFGVSAPTGTATVNLRMAGQYYDSESGLFYNVDRTYNPAIGRYISPDPIGIAGGLNTFGYVGQNPVNGIDPLGLRWIVAAAFESEARWPPTKIQVGHVGLFELNGQTILSQFPSNGGTTGPNVTLTYDQTVAKEGKAPTLVFKIWIPDDDAFDKAAAAERAKSTWNWDPTHDNQTNCTTSSYDALKAGGLSVEDPLISLLYSPDDFMREMKRQAKDQNSKVIQLTNVPWTTSSTAP